MQSKRSSDIDRFSGKPTSTDNIGAEEYVDGEATSVFNGCLRGDVVESVFPAGSALNGASATLTVPGSASLLHAWERTCFWLDVVGSPESLTVEYAHLFMKLRITMLSEPTL